MYLRLRITEKLHAELSSTLPGLRPAGKDASNLCISEHSRYRLLLGKIRKHFPAESLKEKIIPHYGQLESPVFSKEVLSVPRY